MGPEVARVLAVEQVVHRHAEVPRHRGEVRHLRRWRVPGDPGAEGLLTYPDPAGQFGLAEPVNPEQVLDARAEGHESRNLHRISDFRRYPLASIIDGG